MGHGRDTKGDRERRHHVVQERLRTHLAVTSALAEAQTLAEAAPRLLEVVCRGLDWEMGALWRVDPEEQVIRCVDLWHMPGTPLIGFSLATRHAAFAQGEGLPGKVWQDGFPLWVPDIGAHPGQQRGAQAAREDIHAALALPVTAYGEVTGVMEFFSSRVREPDEELMALLTGIGSLVGQFIRHRDAERDVRASEARKSAIVNAAFECIIGLDAHGRVTEFNPAAELTFARPREEAMGLSITDLLVVDRLDEPHRADIDVLSRVGRGQQIDQFETVHVRKDGSTVDVSLTVSPIVDDSGQIVAVSAIARDITEQMRAQAQIEHLAYHDQLTGLPNRSMFHEHLALALARADRHHFGVAVLFIDLDNFKLINDSFGHEAGDALLRDFGARLKSVTRATDIVARQGGDEFLVLVPDLELDGGETIVPRALEVVSAIENKVRSVLETPFLVADTDVHVGLSIGVSIYPIDATDRDELLRNADTAMYIGKGLIENEAAAIEPGKARGRLAMMGELRRAVERDEFELHFQPIVELESRRLVGAETLVRWRDSDGRLVLPEQFVPLAERSGLIEPMTRRVIEGACRQAREWSDQGADLVVSFNLPPGLWGPSIVEMLLDATGRAGVDPSRMMIEVTESTVMVQPARAAHTLSLLRAHGVQMAIDDFGKGHSSLERLRQLPVSTLKIDRSFVADLPHDRGAAAIVVAIIQLAHSLDLQPLAEGIETQEQLDFLLEHGCDLGQGYLLGHPVPARELELTSRP